MVLANAPFFLITSLNGKKRVTLTFKMGEVNVIFFVFVFCFTDNLSPPVIGLPGNIRLILTSELKAFVKYCGFNGSRLFFALLSEIKLTFDEKFQYGFDFISFMCVQLIVNLFAF